MNTLRKGNAAEWDGNWGYFYASAENGQVYISLPSMITVTPELAKQFGEALVEIAAQNSSVSEPTKKGGA